MDILLDTNIIISGLLSSKGAPGQLLQEWLDGSFSLVTSQVQLNELERALGYKKLRSRIHPVQVKDFLENIDVKAHIVPHVTAINLSPDPDDNLILATAISGRAEWIVSGDKPGMLSLQEVRGIPIITAREALQSLQTGNFAPY